MAAFKNRYIETSDGSLFEIVLDLDAMKERPVFKAGDLTPINLVRRGASFPRETSHAG